MPRTDNLHEFPRNLPVPVDDGGCNHLTGMRLPSVPLPSTAVRIVDLASLPGVTVVYCYPRTGRPDAEVPKGWNEIPGARGCTPQSCAYRDHRQEFQALRIRVFGLSTQTTDYQREAVERLHLPMELLSDADLTFARALRLPTFAIALEPRQQLDPTPQANVGEPAFEVESMVLIRRLTLVVVDGRITKVFYPVFPPDKNAEDVLAWLRQHPVFG